MAEPRHSAPTKTTRTWIRWVLGFGVGVAVGLAPFLGRMDIPGFTSLFNVLPFNDRDQIYPLSGFVCAVTAVSYQYWAQGKQPDHRRLFMRALVFTIACFLGFLALRTLFVVDVPLDGNHEFIPVLVSAGRVATCGCPPAMSDVQCVQNISIDVAEIASCWGDGPLRLIRLGLILAYLGLIAAFGLLVGAALVQQGDRPEPPADGPAGG
jgi:hypothetical protein